VSVKLRAYTETDPLNDPEEVQEPVKLRVPDTVPPVWDKLPEAVIEPPLEDVNVNCQVPAMLIPLGCPAAGAL